MLSEESKKGEGGKSRGVGGKTISSDFYLANAKLVMELKLFIAIGRKVI